MFYLFILWTALYHMSSSSNGKGNINGINAHLIDDTRSGNYYSLVGALARNPSNIDILENDHVSVVCIRGEGVCVYMEFDMSIVQYSSVGYDIIAVIYHCISNPPTLHLNNIIYIYISITITMPLTPPPPPLPLRRIDTRLSCTLLPSTDMTPYSCYCWRWKWKHRP